MNALAVIPSEAIVAKAYRESELGVHAYIHVHIFDSERGHVLIPSLSAPELACLNYEYKTTCKVPVQYMVGDEHHL